MSNVTRHPLLGLLLLTSKNLTEPSALPLPASSTHPLVLAEPFFTVIRFFLSTAFNTMAKKKQVALARKEALRKGGNSGSAGEKDQGDADIRSKAAGGSR